MNPFMRFCFAYVLAAFCAIGALSARAQESHWGAEHIRERVAQWLSDNGRRVSSPDTIGPLDPRVRVAACEELQISGRSAASSSLIVECKAPAPWRFVLRTDAGPVGSILPGVPSAPGAREWTSGLDDPRRRSNRAWEAGSGGRSDPVAEAFPVFL